MEIHKYRGRLTPVDEHWRLLLIVKGLQKLTKPGDGLKNLEYHWILNFGYQHGLSTDAGVNAYGYLRILIIVSVTFRNFRRTLKYVDWLLCPLKAVDGFEEKKHQIFLWNSSMVYYPHLVIRIRIVLKSQVVNSGFHERKVTLVDAYCLLLDWTV